MSDHRLLIAKVRSRLPPVPVVQSVYRDLKRLDHTEFAASIRRSSLFTNPATTTDEFAIQLQTVVTAELDKFAPIKTVRRRARKPTARWLSTEAIAAK